MEAFPSGTVSFCFTDIEGSTKLFTRLGERYERLLVEHRRLIHEATASHGGVEVKTEGDGCFLAFQEAGQAVKAAGAIQAAVDQHNWPQDARIRVRVGVHTGEAQPSGQDYVALAVHQAARVADTGHGGQVIVSAQTAAHLDPQSLAPFHLADLGEYRLRSFDEPGHLYQLAGPGLAGAFPPLRTRTAVSKRIRIFLSSPSDVRAAREIAALTIERLAQDYARFFAVEPYFWDYEAMLAAGQFQDPAEPPSAFDIVVLIVWSRLGATLPERTSVREYWGSKESSPLSGTEWEFEEASQAAIARGAPDLLVFRKRSPASVDLWDAKLRDRQLQQLTALDIFWSQRFVNQGTFTGAYNEFTSDAEFAEALDKHLRQLIETRVAAEGAIPGDQAVKVWLQAPFRGLESYEFEHAPIFFGQDEALTKAMVQLVANAETGLPFLLVLGASGSGKSSLVRAGVVPKLFVPRRIPGTAFLRRVVFRPSDAQPGEDLFDALARRLTTKGGTSEGVPELIAPGQSVSNLAAHLRNATAEPGFPIGAVLGQLSVTARRDGRMLDYETAKLILVVDQLEELFTNELIADHERHRFISLLAGFVRSGLVWVVATMRKDFWHRADDTPELVQMSQGNGRLELLPPTPLQLGQMIRRPAAAAGVTFEHQKTTDVPLNEVIADEVSHEPGALPLLSFLLSQLYRNDVLEAHGTTLTFATYERLGRLEGAIATKAEEILNGCSPEDRQALGSVLYSLIQMGVSEGNVERAIARRVPLSTFPSNTSQRRLVDAMLHPDARLLVSDTDKNEKPTVRVAHEALITRWSRAREFVQGNAETLKIRSRIEDRYAIWREYNTNLVDAHDRDATGPTPIFSLAANWRRRLSYRKGLLSDIDLTDGRRLLGKHMADTEPYLVEYVELSIANDKRNRGRALRILAIFATVVTLLAIIAFVAAREAEFQVKQTLQAQSRLLAKVADDRLKTGDINSAENIIPLVLANRTASAVDRATAVNVFLELRAGDAQIAARFLRRAGFNSAAYSPDNRRIVTTSDDDSARILDADTGAQIAVLSGHQGPVIQAFYSSDGRRIVTSSTDNTAAIWDAETGAQLVALKGHTDVVNSATWSPDNRRIVTTSNDKSVRIWDAETGAQIMAISDPGGVGSYAAYSPDGTQIVTASLDKIARIWDARSGKLLVALTGHNDSIGSAGYSPDGNRIVTASNDRTARIWDAHSGAQLNVFRGHTDYVMSAAFSPDGERIVTASKDKTVRIWDASTGSQLAALLGHGAAVSSAVYSPDGNRIVTTSEDHTMRIWTTRNNAQLQVLAGHGNTVTFSGYSPDGKRLVTASDDRTARIWDAATGGTLRILSGHDGPVLGAVFSPNGKQIATGSNDTAARIWDAMTGAQLKLFAGHTDGVNSVAYSPDGARIVTASFDKSARIWDVRTAKKLVTLIGHSDTVESAVFSPDGKLVLTASDDKTARVWDAITGAQRVVLSGHIDKIAAANYSPNGEYIVTASFDKTARIWDGKSGLQLLILAGHGSAVESAAFSPDNRYVVTASDDKTLRIWDAATGVELEVLSGHGDKVNTAAYSPDGQHIVSASADRTARIWSANLPPNLDTQIVWSRAAEFEVLSQSERAELGLPPDTRIRTWRTHITACDRDAGAPYDPDRGAPGIMQDQISAEVASAACAREIAKPGASSRAIYQLGRALLAGGDVKGARQQFERAISKGNRAARIDLGDLFADASSGMRNPDKADLLYLQAWKDGVPIAAFELGRLAEQQKPTKTAAANPCTSPNWSIARRWYSTGANAGEPNSLARLAECEEYSALPPGPVQRKNALLLQAFSDYAAAAERAQDEDWPDDAWKGWRYRRATVARLLAADGLMQQVADAFEKVRDSASVRPPPLLEPIKAWWRSF